MPSSSDPTDRHPAPERLVAYHERRLPPGEVEEMRTHLAACPDCTTQLLALVELLDEQDEPVAAPTRDELDAAWQRQRARLRRTGPPRRRTWVTASLGLAAALLAVVTLVQWRTIVQLRQPQVNLPLVNLEPAGSVRQEARNAGELRFPEEARRAWVILNPVAELKDSSYSVHFVAPDGEVVYRFESLQSSEAGNFRLEIPRDALKEGSYQVLLLRRGSGRSQIVEEYKLSVRLSPAAAP